MRIILTSNLHHGRKEVALSPEWPEFPARARRLATLTKFQKGNLKKWNSYVKRGSNTLLIICNLYTQEGGGSHYGCRIMGEASLEM